MTYEQIKNINIEKIIEQTDWLKLAKECLGIVETAVLKDKEITMLIGSAVEDLLRVDIDIENHIEDSLVKNTVMLYVKAHFGDADLNKQNQYLRRYKENMRELQFSSKYQKKEVDSNA